MARIQEWESRSLKGNLRDCLNPSASFREASELRRRRLRRDITPPPLTTRSKDTFRFPLSIHPGGKSKAGTTRSRLG